ncbi:MAG: type VII secretion protein EccE [Actinobacteria bacterium]|nr:type VII secretion protein EccE [Actinomycetota bacterium]
MFGVRVTVPRTVLVIIAGLAWVMATLGRLHPAAVAAVPIVLMLVVFITIYHVALTHWMSTWWTWLRHRRSVAAEPPPPARNVFINGVPIGVVAENEQLITLVELHNDPLAPSVVTDTEERTPNVLDIGELAGLVGQVLDVGVNTADIISDGFRATGGFADLYQQITGPTVAPAERSSWIVVRTDLHDNLAAIDRRGGDAEAADRVAAATCLRIADTLASSGLDARPASAEAIDAVNALLHVDAPIADHWSHLEGRSGFTGVYYADPAHIGDDAAQWWTWPLSQSVTTLVRLTPGANGATNIAALVRYRTDARPPAPPVSRLGPLYGVQTAMWQQFRVGYLPVTAPLPSAALGPAAPVLPFGPAGPLIGSIGDPRDHTSVHLSLSGPITVLCQSAVLLRQAALRASVTGRPLLVITDERDKWQPIVSLAVSGVILDDYPAGWAADDDDGLDDDDAAIAAQRGSGALGLAGLDQDTVLVIDTDEDWPEHLPQVTVLTDDEACDADIELVDTDDQFGFTLKIRTGLSARVRSVPAHEERRILGVSPQPTTVRGPVRQADRPKVPVRPRPPATRPRPAPVRSPRQPNGQDTTEASQPPTADRTTRTRLDLADDLAGHPGTATERSVDPVLPAPPATAASAEPPPAAQPGDPITSPPPVREPGPTPPSPPPQPIRPPAAAPWTRPPPRDATGVGRPPDTPRIPPPGPLPPRRTRNAQPAPGTQPHNDQPTPPESAPTSPPAGQQRDWAAAFGRSPRQPSQPYPPDGASSPLPERNGDSNGRHRTPDDTDETNREQRGGKNPPTAGPPPGGAAPPPSAADRREET